MKWAASELKNRGKKVYLVDLSGEPDPNSLKNVISLPSGIANAVIGITKSDPGDLVPLLREKAQGQGQPKPEMEQRAIHALQQDPQMRQAFFNQVAAPTGRRR